MANVRGAGSSQSGSSRLSLGVTAAPTGSMFDVSIVPTGYHKWISLCNTCVIEPSGLLNKLLKNKFVRGSSAAAGPLSSALPPPLMANPICRGHAGQCIACTTRRSASMSPSAPGQPAGSCAIVTRWVRESRVPGIDAPGKPAGSGVDPLGQGITGQLGSKARVVRMCHRAGEGQDSLLLKIVFYFRILETHTLL